MIRVWQYFTSWYEEIYSDYEESNDGINGCEYDETGIYIDGDQL